MDEIIQTAYNHSLSDIDINKVTRNQGKVLLYKDLQKYNHILDAIGPTNQLVLLFPVESDTNGHWIALIFHPKTNIIYHFDSYGLSPEQEISYTKNQYVQKRILNNMLDDAVSDGYVVKYNTHRLQVMKAGVNDCGRFASVRCRFHYLTNNEFASFLLNQKMSPDWLVTCMTFLLTKDEIDEEDRIKTITKYLKKDIKKENQDYILKTLKKKSNQS